MAAPAAAAPSPLHEYIPSYPCSWVHTVILLFPGLSLNLVTCSKRCKCGNCSAVYFPYIVHSCAQHLYLTAPPSHSSTDDRQGQGLLWSLSGRCQERGLQELWGKTNSTVSQKSALSPNWSNFLCTVIVYSNDCPPISWDGGRRVYLSVRVHWNSGKHSVSCSFISILLNVDQIVSLRAVKASAARHTEGYRMFTTDIAVQV